jgi:hypothetical protein
LLAVLVISPKYINVQPHQVCILTSYFRLFSFLNEFTIGACAFSAGAHRPCLMKSVIESGCDPGENAVGTSTTGSSEAAMLGGMAMKRRWEAQRRHQGNSTAVSRQR